MTGWTRSASSKATAEAPASWLNGMKEIRGDDVTDLLFGVEMPQHMGFDYLKGMARGIEDVGYDSIWIRDHLMINPQEMDRFPQGYILDGRRVVSRSYLGCIPTLAAVAAVTDRVLLGTDILNVPRRNPADIANEIATIDQVSHGRVILQGAIGQPTRDWDPLGSSPPLKQRGEMLEEAIHVIRLLWTNDDPVSFKGQFYTLDEARIGCRPVQSPHPPIWLGVGRTFKRVARIASGYTLTHSMFGGTVEHFKEGYQRIRDEAEKLGKDPDGIVAAARFAVVVGESDREAKGRAADDWATLWREEEEWHAAWAGSPETVAEVIAPYIEAGASHVMLWPIPYAGESERMQDIELFGREVIPLLRGASTTSA